MKACLYFLNKISKKKTQSQSGQALLIVLLLMSVVLAIILASLSRSITDISISTYEEDALKAFSAAEAGVEEVLLSDLTSGSLNTTFSTGASYQVDISQTSSSDKEFIYPENLSSAETANFWMTSRNADGDFECGSSPCFAGSSLTFCWGKTGVESAISVSLFYDESFSKATASPNNYEDVKVVKAAYDPLARGNFSLSSGSCSVGEQTFPYSTTLNLTSLLPCASERGCLLLSRVKTHYADADEVPVAIVSTGGGASAILPAQGVQISSTGVSGNSTRRVNVFKSNSQLPFPLDSAIFSLKDIVKTL